MGLQEKIDRLRLPIGDHIELRTVSNEEYWPLFRENAEKIFAEAPVVGLRDVFDEQEKKQIATLSGLLGNPLQMRLGLFEGERFIGWCYARQTEGAVLYMQNSAILPEYRRRGLYTRLCQEVITLAGELGFQTIFSKHSVTNNDVIIPKLKQGFKITTMQLDDCFGTLVHLSYHFKEIRHRLLDTRCGNRVPDREQAELLGLVSGEKAVWD